MPAAQAYRAKFIHKTLVERPGMAVHACNPLAGEVETGDSVWPAILTKSHSGWKLKAMAHKTRKKKGTTEAALCAPYAHMTCAFMSEHIHTKKIHHKNILKKTRTLVLKRNCNLRCWKPPGSCDCPLDSSTPHKIPRSFQKGWG